MVILFVKMDQRVKTISSVFVLQALQTFNVIPQSHVSTRQSMTMCHDDNYCNYAATVENTEAPPAELGSNYTAVCVFNFTSPLFTLSLLGPNGEKITLICHHYGLCVLLIACFQSTL